MSRSVGSVTVFIALNGFCKTVNHWVPFSLVSDSLPRTLTRSKFLTPCAKVGEAILLEARGKVPIYDDDVDGSNAGPEMLLLEDSIAL